MMEAPKANFDCVARVYRWAEYLTQGPLLQRVRTHHIPKLFGCRSAYVLGDGDGRFLAELLASHTSLKVLAVDSSSMMLTLLKRRCCFASERLRTQHDLAEAASAPADTDLVVTHFFLDCLSQNAVEKLIVKTVASCRNNVTWLVSDFVVPSQGWLRLSAKLYIRLLYLIFRVLTGLRVQQLPDVRKAFTECGFTHLERAEFLGGLLYTELWQHTSSADLNDTTPVSGRVIHQHMRDDTNNEVGTPSFPGDALSNPEPPVPSLPEPDPAIFHHQPGTASPNTKTEKPSE